MRSNLITLQFACQKVTRKIVIMHVIMLCLADTEMAATPQLSKAWRHAG